MKSYIYQIAFNYNQKQVFLNFADKRLLQSPDQVKDRIQIRNPQYLAGGIERLEYKILAKA